MTPPLEWEVTACAMERTECTSNPWVIWGVLLGSLIPIAGIAVSGAAAVVAVVIEVVNFVRVCGLLF